MTKSRLSLHSPTPHGIATTGSIIGIAALMAVGWFLQHPKEQRAGLVCKPAAWLQDWMEVKDQNDDTGRKMNLLFARLRADCPETIGKPTADVSDQVNAQTGKVVAKVVDTATIAAGRRIEAVVDGERLKVEALGVTRLLGVTVPTERQSRAVAYLKDTVLEKSVSVTIDKAKDPNRRPLILVTLPDGTLLNAQMVKYGLATPWNNAGPWQQWGK